MKSCESLQGGTCRNEKSAFVILLQENDRVESKPNSAPVSRFDKDRQRQIAQDLARITCVGLQQERIDILGATNSRVGTPVSENEHYSENIVDKLWA